MPDPFTAKLVFDRTLAANFSNGLKSQLGNGIAKIARDTEGRMKTTCPVDTGFLKNSILAAPTGSMQWQITVGAQYGIYVEMGTVKMAAQPFFFPAISAVEPAFIEMIRQAVEKAAQEAQS